jgi:phosphoribosylformimino-5-aminoimidazole carboxamide ribotide isomerase
MTIIPAIDIIDGKCVRLTEGNYAEKKIYNEHPLEVAKQLEDAGIQRLHLVDLDGAKQGQIINWKVLETIASKTGLVIDFGGGVSTEDHCRAVLSSGARYITVGSVAAKKPAIFLQWLEQFGSDHFFLGADVKDNFIATAGWLEASSWQAIDFIQHFVEKGVQHIFCTDISKDGKLAGPGLALYQTILDAVPGVQLVASGGVATLQHLDELKTIGCHAAIVGKAIYEQTIPLPELTTWIEKNSYVN